MPKKRAEQGGTGWGSTGRGGEGKREEGRIQLSVKS